MNLYFKLSWLCLVFFLVSEVVIASMLGMYADSSIIIVFILVLLPVIDLAIQEIRKGVNAGFLICESRIFFFGALLLLSFCPILVITNHSILTESVSLYVYYSLSIGLCMQIWENIRSHKKQNNPEPNKQIPALSEKIFHQISLYFETTNLLIAPIVFVSLLFVLLGRGENSNMIIYSLLLVVGYLYNSFYRDTTELFFQKETTNTLKIAFILTLNISLCIYLNELFMRNLQESYISIIAFMILLFDIIGLSAWTDVIEKMNIKYRIYLQH